MSSNKGKDGEMRIIRSLCDISESTDGCDFIRPTITNNSDDGADLILIHPKGFLDNLESIASGKPPQNEVIYEAGKNERSRIDAKNTDKKINKAMAEDFVGKIKLNPDCKGHILMGADNEVTRGAKKVLDAAKEECAKTGKKILIIPNTGVALIADHFKKKLEATKPDSESRD